MELLQILNPIAVTLNCLAVVYFLQEKFHVIPNIESYTNTLIKTLRLGLTTVAATSLTTLLGPVTIPVFIGNLAISGIIGYAVTTNNQKNKI